MNEVPRPSSKASMKLAGTLSKESRGSDRIPAITKLAKLTSSQSGSRSPHDATIKSLFRLIDAREKAVLQLSRLVRTFDATKAQEERKQTIADTKECLVIVRFTSGEIVRQGNHVWEALNQPNDPYKAHFSNYLFRMQSDLTFFITSTLGRVLNVRSTDLLFVRPDGVLPPPEFSASVVQKVFRSNGTALSDTRIWRVTTDAELESLKKTAENLFWQNLIFFKARILRSTCQTNIANKSKPAPYVPAPRPPPGPSHPTKIVKGRSSRSHSPRRPASRPSTAATNRRSHDLTLYAASSEHPPLPLDGDSPATPPEGHSELEADFDDVDSLEPQISQRHHSYTLNITQGKSSLAAVKVRPSSCGPSRPRSGMSFHSLSLGPTSSHQLNDFDDRPQSAPLYPGVHAFMDPTHHGLLAFPQQGSVLLRSPSNLSSTNSSSHLRTVMGLRGSSDPLGHTESHEQRAPVSHEPGHDALPVPRSPSITSPASIRSSSSALKKLGRSPLYHSFHIAPSELAEGHSLSAPDVGAAHTRSAPSSPMGQFL